MPCFEYSRKGEAEGDLQLLKDAEKHKKLDNCEICLKHSPKMVKQELLRKITITSGTFSDAPKVLFLYLNGHLWQNLPEKSGMYFLQDSLIDGFPFWKNNEQNLTIWFNKINDHWSISNSKDVGTANWVFAGPKNISELPHRIDSDWKYKSAQYGFSYYD